MLVRLNKFLSQCGIVSRRDADRMIVEGRIRVNGRIVSELGAKVDASADRVEVAGRRVKGSPSSLTILLNKPAGTVVTLKDPSGRPTVRDLLPRSFPRVFPVGRLDAGTTGVLLLTNDGDLAFRMTHPSFEISKIYLARVEGEPDPSALDRLRKGLVVEGKKTSPARVDLLRRSRGRSLVRLELYEGRKREVRRMLEAVGHPVLELERVRFAGLSAAGLRRGQWRVLTPAEVARLKALAGLEPANPRA